jgi:hypothetical protein
MPVRQGEAPSEPEGATLSAGSDTKVLGEGGLLASLPAAVWRATLTEMAQSRLTFDSSWRYRPRRCPALRARRSPGRTTVAKLVEGGTGLDGPGGTGDGCWRLPILRGAPQIHFSSPTRMCAASCSKCPTLPWGKAVWPVAPHASSGGRHGRVGSRRSAARAGDPPL